MSMPVILADMRLTIAVCLLLPALTFAQRRTVDPKTEEAAIRAIIASGQAPKTTDDAIFWTGASPRPSIGSNRTPSYPEAMVEKRKNNKSSFDAQRIEVAASGDLAYDFSLGHLEYDIDITPPRHVSFDRGILRVWKKDHGEWKVAATFARPLDEPYHNLPGEK
jgi:ketosteroid isomerase-like protein